MSNSLFIYTYDFIHNRRARDAVYGIQVTAIFHAQKLDVAQQSGTETDDEKYTQCL